MHAEREGRGRSPGGTDLLLALIALIISGGGIFAWSSEIPRDPTAIAGAATLAVIGSGALLFRRRAPVLVALIAAAVFVVYDPLAAPVQPVPVIVALYTLPAERARASLPVSASIVGLLGAYLLVRARWIDPSISAQDVLTFLLVLVIAWAAGYAVGVRRAHVRTLEERARLLEERNEEAARGAVAEERARIARELHDIVAHHVTMMVVQAGGARRIIDRDPSQARDALGAIESAGREALNEMRRVLGTLRNGEAASLAPAPGLDQLEQLVEQARVSGLQVSLRFEGKPRDVPPAIGVSAYRIVQEAVTNAIKHAGEASVAVLVTFERDALAIEVTDDGRGSTAVVPAGTGHGLVGMRERVSVFGGELLAGPRVGGGFTVRARIPMDGDVS